MNGDVWKDGSHDLGVSGRKDGEDGTSDTEGRVRIAHPRKGGVRKESEPEE
jgi:hypothetical protein